MIPISLRRSAGILAALSAAMLGAAIAAAQTPPTPPTPPTPEAKAAAPQASEPSPLAPLAWLEGCWRGSANRREFREHWMPLRGNLMVGVSQTVMKDKTLDFEYLRVEPRADGVYYVILPPGRNETAYKLTESAGRWRGRRIRLHQSCARIPEEDHLPSRRAGMAVRDGRRHGQGR